MLLSLSVLLHFAANPIVPRKAPPAHSPTLHTPGFAIIMHPADMGVLLALLGDQISGWLTRTCTCGKATRTR